MTLIEGVAGRYFVPLLLPLVIVVSGHCRFTSRYPKICVVAIAAAMAVVNFAAVRLVASHYYTTERIVLDTVAYSMGDVGVLPLGPGVRVEQTFVPRSNKLIRLDFDVGTYGRVLEAGVLFATISTGNGRELSRHEIPLESIKGNDTVTLRLRTPIAAKGEALTLSLRVDASNGGVERIGLYTSSGREDRYASGVLRVAGRPLPGRDLLFRAYRRGGAKKPPRFVRTP